MIDLTKLNEPKVIDNFLSDEDVNNLSHVCSYKGLNTLEIERWRWTNELGIEYGDWDISSKEFLQSFKKKSPNAKFNVQSIKQLVKNSDNLFFDYTSNDEQQGHWVWWSDKNNITPLHKDPYDNFILQLSGEKEWIVFSDEYDDIIYNNPDWDGGYGFAVSDLNIDDIDFPHHKFVCKPGQLLFIPRGWSHYVKTLSRSYSVNCFFQKSESEVLCKFLKLNNVDIKVLKENNVYLMGGSILRLFMGLPLDTDLDFYFVDNKSFKNVDEYFENNFTFLYESPTSKNYQVGNLIVQLIHNVKSMGSYDDIVSTFDFTLATGCFDFKNNKFRYSKSYFDDIKNKRLIPNSDLNNQYSVNLLHRIEKFKSLGFTVDDELVNEVKKRPIVVDKFQQRVVKKSWLRNEDVYPNIPNIDVFVNWLMEIKEHKYFDKFNYYLFGGFISWPEKPTRDIDILISKRDGKYGTLEELELIMVDMFDLAYDIHGFFLDTFYMRTPQWIADYPRDENILRSVEQKGLWVTITKDQPVYSLKFRRYGKLNCCYRPSFTNWWDNGSDMINRWVNLNANYARIIDLRRIIKYYENNKERNMKDFLNEFQEYSGY
jgi:hypothetical protein